MSMTPVKVRVRRHRETLRQSGLRPVQIWVPDTRRPGFADECQRQCLAVSRTDAQDGTLSRLMDEALSDLEGWTP